MSKQQPSPFQQAIYNEIQNGKNSIVISAVAGAGKTTTIVNALSIISPDEDTIFLAFNKSIVKELTERVPNYVNVSTLHSFGCRAYMNAFGRVKIDENKMFNIAVKLSDKWNINATENKFSYCGRVCKLVDMMRFSLTTEDETEIFNLANKYSIMIVGDEIQNAIDLLAAGNKQTDVIDFTDMIYQPAVRNIKMKKYKYVFVDELQDLNRAQQAIIKKIVHPNGGRFIGVGDPYQSIYGFAGADIDSFNRMRTMFPNTTELPLSVCYRCSKEIIKHAQRIVPHIQYFEGQIDGEPPREGSFKEIKHHDYVACRNTKPLIVAFIQLLKEGKKANIKGKEIGKSLSLLIQKTGQKTTAKLMKYLEVERLKLKSKLTKKGVQKVEEHDAMIQMRERIEIIEILSKGMPTCKMICEYIERIFLDENMPGIVLSTIHKLKGLEADRVFVLCPELMPSKYAIQEHDKIQESNLEYVLITRAKKQLIYVNDFHPDDYKAVGADVALAGVDND